MQWVESNNGQLISFGEQYLCPTILKDHLEGALPFFYHQGKPMHPSYYVSLSHSENIHVLGISQQDLGVDIQEINPHLDQSFKRGTCHPVEHTHFDTDSPWVLTLLWSAKEAIYKLKPFSDPRDIGLRPYQDYLLWRDYQVDWSYSDGLFRCLASISKSI